PIVSVHMQVIDLLKTEILNFFSVNGLIDLLRSGNYSALKSWNGITVVLSPLIPFVIVVELLLTVLYRKFTVAAYKISFLIYAFNRFVSRFLSLSVMAFCIGLFAPYAPLHASLSWYWFIYAYIAWEFAHFVYHYLGHKVRLFWCLHSQHHAPETMNLS